MRGYSVREAAEIFGIKVRTMREWLKLGKIKAEKESNKRFWRIPESEIVRRQFELEKKRIEHEDKYKRNSV